MPIAIRGTSDSSIEQVARALSRYELLHREAQIEVYRQNSESIRVRIIDPDFAETSRADRHEIVWRFFEDLPERVQSQVSLLIALTPEETDSSLANFEFDNPIPSGL